MSYIKAPKPAQQEMYDYLEKLRQSGETNMFGAGVYLQHEFDLSRKEATAILSDWMEGHYDPARILPKPLTKVKAGRFVTRYESAQGGQ